VSVPGAFLIGRSPDQIEASAREKGAIGGLKEHGPRAAGEIALLAGTAGTGKLVQGAVRGGQAAQKARGASNIARALATSPGRRIFGKAAAKKGAGFAKRHPFVTGAGALGAYKLFGGGSEDPYAAQAAVPPGTMEAEGGQIPDTLAYQLLAAQLLSPYLEQMRQTGMEQAAHSDRMMGDLPAEYRPMARNFSAQNLSLVNQLSAAEGAAAQMMPYIWAREEQLAAERANAGGGGGGAGSAMLQALMAGQGE
jgi:hypothetical protein